MQLGLREANQQFSRLMRAVRSGKEVLLTERGKPFAVVRPIRSSNDPESVIERLETTGLLRPAARRASLPSWKPRIVRGVPLSRTVREERDER